MPNDLTRLRQMGEACYRLGRWGSVRPEISENPPLSGFFVLQIMDIRKAKEVESDMNENRQGSGRRPKRKAPKTAFRKGQSGNPRGRPKKTEEERDLVAACKAKVPAALAVIERIMKSGQNERNQLSAAMAIIERAYGKAVETRNVNVKRTIADLDDAELASIAAGGGEGIAESAGGPQESQQFH